VVTGIPGGSLSSFCN